MLRFDTYKKGKPARPTNLEGAHLVGGEGYPLRGQITVENHSIVCEKRMAGAAALSLLWPVSGAGTVMLETARVPERDEPYVLNVELARGRLMRIAQKQEEWGLFDYAGPEMAEVDKRLDHAKDLFIEALKADDPAEAAKLADRALAAAVPASEAMARVHADVLLQRKRNGPAAKRGLGVQLPVGKTLKDPIQVQLPELVDVASVPLPWRHLQPREHGGDYAFDEVDEQISWLVKNHIPVMAGPLLSFAEEQIPDWLILYEDDFEAVRDLALEHIRRVVQRYGRFVTYWRVVSGLHAASALTFPFEQMMDLTRRAVSTTKELAPKSVAIVEIAEPWGEYYARKANTIPPGVYADVLMQTGLNFDAFGLALPMGMPARGGYTRDLFAISTLIERFGALNKPLHITSFGVPSSGKPDPRDCTGGQADPALAGRWRGGWSEQIQGYWAGHFCRVALARPFVETLIWEDLCDSLPHTVPNGGILRADGSPKPIWDELLSVRKEIIGARNNAAGSGSSRRSRNAR